MASPIAAAVEVAARALVDQPAAVQVIETTHRGVTVVELSVAPGDVGMVNIVCILETRDAQHVREIQDALKAAGIRSELR